MSEALKQLRRTLSQQVDGAWVGRLDEKDELAKIARGAYEKCLEKCITGKDMKGATNVAECYKKCAEEVNLSTKYRSAWGAPTGGAGG